MAPSLHAICRGEAGCCCNLLCAPFVLLWNALDIYIFTCIGVLCTRLYRCVCFPLLRCCCWTYTDSSFEGGAVLKAAHSDADWVRVTDVLDGKRPKLYEGSIEPADLCQGAVGNCWLVAALASAADHPGAIRKAFVTREYNPRGKYAVRLYLSLIHI